MEKVKSPEAAERPSILLGASDDGVHCSLDAAMANRHGLITGATGTGKTIALQVLAEAFFKSLIRTIGTTIGRQIVRGVMGGVRRR